MNILYIYGYNGSSNSVTGKNLKEVFPEHNVYCIDYPQNDIKSAVDTLQNYIYTNNINVVIASSYGAFISLFLRNVVKFLINPCMRPTTELPKIGAPDEFVKDAAKYEKNLSSISFDESLITFGLFSDHDELFGEKYKETFKYFGNVISISKCGHRATKEMFEQELKPIFNNCVNNAIHDWKNN
ncbi:hypothetical protein [uncultured Methanobrevibacter sp.]|uniref:hypothetical protein n=1 Tax=uncultured Methanobrevibacter sp. TaxID=253161 RepID=UPI0025D6521A|nr:hypothetical protein [uncultured Methanobrevibacter sp.]